MIDKSSPEWNEYCEGLLRFDDHFDNGTFIIPPDPNNDFQVDWIAFKKFIEDKYDGDSSLATKEEKEAFIIKEKRKQIA